MEIGEAMEGAASVEVRDKLLAELHSGLVSLYGDRLVDVILYGSEARGEARSDSDVDVVIVLVGPVEPGREIGRLGDLLAALNLHYGRLVSVVPIAAADYAAARDPFWRSVQRDGLRV